MKIIFCGDRYWKDKGMIGMVMSAIHGNVGDFTVIEGEANGADTLAKQCAEEIGLVVDKYPAAWDLFGKAAGPRRNAEMLKDADAVVAFHNDLSKSKGTANMIAQALKAFCPVWINTNGPAKLAEFIIKLKGLK